MRRILTAAILVPVVLAVVIWAPLWLFASLILLVALMALREFYDLAQAQGCEPYRWLGLTLAAVVVLWCELPWRSVDSRVFTAILAACLLAVLVRALTLPERLGESVGDAGASLLGVVYLGLLMGLTGAIRLWGSGWFLFLLAVVWLGDTAALYVGKAWGRHAMAPHVSPHKTWEGAAGSLAAAAAVGAGFGHWFVGHPLLYAALAGAINVAAQCGDLVESVFKRGAHVKDSGGLLPGHGGMLDRIDAMLFAAPVLWYYLAYFRT